MRNPQPAALRPGGDGAQAQDVAVPAPGHGSVPLGPAEGVQDLVLRGAHEAVSHQDMPGPSLVSAALPGGLMPIGRPGTALIPQPAPRSPIPHPEPAAPRGDQHFDVMRRHVVAALEQNSALGERVAATAGGRAALLRTAVLTAQGEVALASHHGPAVAALPGAPVQAVLRRYLEEPDFSVQPGDAFLFMEPPGHSAAAASEGLLMPCFHERQLVAWVACALTEAPGQASHSAAAALETAAPVKVAETWRLTAVQPALARCHGRAVPHATTNLHAWLATCMRLCESLHGQLEHHGPEQVAGMLRHALQRVSETVADRLQDWPQGTVRGDFYLQGTPQGEPALFKLAVALTVQGRRCVVDLRGSACEIGNRGLNLTLQATRQCLLDALVGGPWPDLPNLPAVLQPFELRVDPFSLLAASGQAPAGHNHLTRELLAQGFASLLAKLAGPGWGAWPAAGAAAGLRACAVPAEGGAASCTGQCHRPGTPGPAAPGARPESADPLDRPPLQVLAQVQRGLLAPRQAWDAHAVVLQSNGMGVDAVLTRDERQRRRQARLAGAMRWPEALGRHVRSAPAPGVPFYGRWNRDETLLAGLQRVLPERLPGPVDLVDAASLPAAWARMQGVDRRTDAAAGRRPIRRAPPAPPLTPGAAAQLVKLCWQAVRVACRVGLALPMYSLADAPTRRAWRQQRMADALGRAVGRLGPGSKKMARLAAARPEWVGAEVAAHLSLHPPQAHVLPPFLTMRIAERGLGAPLRELFLRFDPTPLAAGPICQVHAAVLHDGRRCAVKIRRPGVERVLAAELGAWGVVTRLLARCPGAAGRQARHALDGMAETLRENADFRAEATRHARWADELAGLDGLYLPPVFPAYCGDSVITMEHARGLAPAAWLAQHGGRDAAQARRLYQLGWRLQLARHLLQAGPQAGHVLIDGAGRLVLLDTTLLSRIDAVASLRWLRACMAAVAGDAALWLAAALGPEPWGAVGSHLPARRHVALAAELQRHFDHWAAASPADTARLWLGTTRVLARHGAVLDEPLHRAMGADLAMARLAQLFDPAFDAPGFFQRELPAMAVEHGPLRPDDPFLLAATRCDLRPAIRAAWAARYLPPPLAAPA